MSEDMPKILYVDDEFINLELFRLNFEYEMEVFIAESPEKGLELLKEHDFKVIVSDLKMPEMNGIEFIREIKKTCPGKVCILLTAYVESDAMIQAINEDLIFKYIVKPWRREDLKAVIDAAYIKFEEDAKMREKS